MAFSSKQEPRGGRSSHSTLAEINVTPLVDVMLVLLIIFMVTAPLIKHGVSVNLPKTDAGALREPHEPFLLTINAKQQVLLNGTEIPKGTLGDKLQALAATTPDASVYIQADASLPYGVVAEVLSEVSKAKIGKVGLVTTPGAKSGRF